MKKLLRTVLFIFIAYWFVKVAIGTYNNTLLGLNGVAGKAVISPKKYKGARRHGPGKYYYYFNVDGKFYGGDTEKEKGVFIGDTIDIFYLESDPNINCSYEDAKSIFYQQIVKE